MNHNEPKLGELIEGEAQRDAVHVAIAPVIAAEELWPGMHIGFVEGSTERVRGSYPTKPFIGVVDPFLTVPVQPEQRFWMWLYPRTITSLRHDWSHPAFETGPAPAYAAMEKRIQESREWIQDFANRLGDLDYEGVVQAARDYNDHGRYLTEQGSTSWQDALYNCTEEFWKHWEIVTGEKAKDNSAHFFSCSC